MIEICFAGNPGLHNHLTHDRMGFILGQAFEAVEEPERIGSKWSHASEDIRQSKKGRQWYNFFQSQCCMNIEYLEGHVFFYIILSHIIFLLFVNEYYLFVVFGSIWNLIQTNNAVLLHATPDFAQIHLDFEQIWPVSSGNRSVLILCLYLYLYLIYYTYI